MAMSSRLRSVAVQVLRGAMPRRAAFSLAALRGRALILVYHRVSAETAGDDLPSGSIVPVVTTALLRQHLEALSRVGDFLPLADIATDAGLDPSQRSTRIRFAVTFDDDETSHTAHAAPMLRSMGIPATFFLSGRVLNALGAPWWTRLEARIASQGLSRTAAELGVTAQSPGELAGRCEGTPLTDRIDAEMPPPDPGSVLSREGIATLAAMQGMTIGFHTLRHPVLTRLDDPALDRALTEGRAALEAICGQRIDQFAYPHGKFDQRTAERVERAGFRLACGSGQRPVTVNADRFSLSRWEPGPMNVEDLMAHTAMRLSLPLLPRNILPSVRA